MDETLRQNISLLEQTTGALEPSEADLEGWLQTLARLSQDWIKGLPEKSVFTEASSDALLEFCDKVRLEKDATALMETLMQDLSKNGINAASGGHLGFIPGGGLMLAASADYLAAMINTFSGDFYSSPIASQIHHEAIMWLIDQIGFGHKSFGDITSGGSHATLTAFMVAREAMNIKSADMDRSVIYLTSQTHHCAQKAIKVVFGNEVIVRDISLSNHRMDARALEAQIEDDLLNSLKPMMVIATAGSTNFGLVDPLEAIAQIGKKHRLWLHCDGAYGGFFVFCHERKDLLKGMSLFDSLVLDPHKGLFLPYGCGAVLIKDQAAMGRALTSRAAYLKDREHEHVIPSAMDYSLELSRPFRSLRLWLAIKVYGKELFAKALQEKLALAEYTTQKLTEFDQLELFATSDLSITAFCHKDGDEATLHLLKAMNLSGKVFLSSTTYQGKLWIRIAILSFRTHLSILDSLIALLRTELFADKGYGTSDA